MLPKHFNWSGETFALLPSSSERRRQTQRGQQLDLHKRLTDLQASKTQFTPLVVSSTGTVPDDGAHTSPVRFVRKHIISGDICKVLAGGIVETKGDPDGIAGMEYEVWIQGDSYFECRSCDYLNVFLSCEWIFFIVCIRIVVHWARSTLRDDLEGRFPKMGHGSR